MSKVNLNYLDLITVICALIIGFQFSDYRNLKETILNEAKLLNNTQFANQSFIVFNRVPKAGSETLWTLLDRLQKINSFNSYSDNREVKRQRGTENTYVQKEIRKNYVEMMAGINTDGEVNITVPFSYVKHINFLNFEEFNKSNPIYINMVCNRYIYFEKNHPHIMARLYGKKYFKNKVTQTNG